MGDAVLFNNNKIFEYLSDNRAVHILPLGDQMVIDNGLGLGLVPDYTREGQAANGIAFFPGFLAFKKINLITIPVEGIPFQGRAGFRLPLMGQDFFRPHREDVRPFRLKRERTAEEENGKKEEAPIVRHGLSRVVLPTTILKVTLAC